MATIDDIRARRDEILALAERYKATDVRLFGSVVRGDDRPESDVDFLVRWKDGASLFDVAGLTTRLSDLLERSIDVAGEDELKPRIRDRVLTEAALL